MAKLIFISAAKDADRDVVEQAIEDAGLKRDNIKETKNAVLFMQEPDVPADVQLLEVDDGVYLAVAEMPINKADLYCCGTDETTSFTERLNREGVYPMLGVANDTLRSVVSSVVRQAKSHEEASKGIGEATKEYASFVKGVIEKIPMTAFKFADAYDDVQTARLQAAFQEGLDAEEPPKENAKKKELLDGLTATEENKEPAKKADETATAKKGEEEKPAAAVEEKKSGNELDGAIDAISARIEASMAKRFDAIDSKVETLGGRIEKTERSLKSTTMGMGDDGDHEHKDAPVQKSGNGGFSFDTAGGMPL